jgi:PAS domain-containing protein
VPPRPRQEPDPENAVEMAAFTAQAIGPSAAATFVVASDGTIVSWSEEAARLFSRPSWAAVGRPCHQVVAGLHPDGCPACTQNCRVRLDARLGSSPPSYDLRVPASPGGPPARPVRVHHVALRDPLGYAAGLLHVLEPARRPA